jgi:hypothetical protein
MFKSIGRSLPDLSSDLRERQDWEVGTLRTLDPLLNATTFAFDPVSSILAIGGSPSCHFVLDKRHPIRQARLTGQFGYLVLLEPRQACHSRRHIRPSNSCNSRRMFSNWSASVSIITYASL